MPLRRLLLLALLAAPLTASACAGSHAYVEWRPGLTLGDFDGLFELSRAEYEAFAVEAKPNTHFDRYHGVSQPEASAAMTELGERLSRTEATPDPRGWSIVGLKGDGTVTLLDARARQLPMTVDWFAVTADRQGAAVIAGSKLSVVLGSASTGIDLGSLLGTALGGYEFLLLVDGAELTVFALPEIGGVVTDNEPGFVLSFRHHPGAREEWEITAARVSITL